MRILAVAPESVIFPVGLSYIAAALKASGHAVTGVLLRQGKPLRVDRSSYDFVAVGGLATQLREIERVAAVAQEADVPLILGGGIVTSEPELVTRHLMPRYAVLGEGEQTIVRLLHALERGDPIDPIPGIARVVNGQFVSTGTSPPVADLDALPLPDYDCFGFSAHLDGIRASDLYYYNIFDRIRPYPVVASRSCPFQCTFCWHPLGKKYRQRSIDSIMRELEVRVPQYRINFLEVLDELFSYDEGRVNEFCARLKALAARLPWELKWGCQLRIDHLTGAMLDALEDSGCATISYGFESASPAVLKSMKKRTTPQQIENAIELTHARRLGIQGNFIFGDRAETRQTARETLAFWRRKADAGIYLDFIIPAPNCELYRYCLNQGIIRDRIDFLRHLGSRVYNMTGMPMRAFIDLQVEVFRAKTRHVRHSTPRRMDRDGVDVRCPHCGTVVAYRNFTPSSILPYSKRVPIRWRPVNHDVYCRHCLRRFWIRSKSFEVLAPALPLLLRGLLTARHLRARFQDPGCRWTER